MVNDLMVKAKQIEFLINSLPEPETEETQVCYLPTIPDIVMLTYRRRIDSKNFRTTWSKPMKNTSAPLIVRVRYIISPI